VVRADSELKESPDALLIGDAELLALDAHWQRHHQLRRRLPDAGEGLKKMVRWVPNTRMISTRFQLPGISHVAGTTPHTRD
jgi:hypothetical protein